MPWVADDPPPGLHLSMSQDADGTARGLLFDNQNRLVGHAKLRWVDDVPSGDVRQRAEPDAVDDSSFSSGASAPDISNLVPLVLVVAAGIAAGVAGVKIAQNRKRRRQEERVDVAAATAAPAGWYEMAAGAGQLRYWNGVMWTDETAQRARTAPSIAAAWYPDPANLAQIRYWDGAAWTHHVAPRSGAVSAPADWYPDPSNAAQLRYWDGTAWTGHVTAGPGASVAAYWPPSSNGGDLASVHDEPRIRMTSAEWRAHVEAWAQAGAIQQEMWRRLANARITDDDGLAIAAQRQWEELTPQEGAGRIQLMLEANPSLRSQSVLEEFVRLFASGQESPHQIEGDRGQR